MQGRCRCCCAVYVLLLSCGLLRSQQEGPEGCSCQSVGCLGAAAAIHALQPPKGQLLLVVDSPGILGLSLQADNVVALSMHCHYTVDLDFCCLQLALVIVAVNQDSLKLYLELLDVSQGLLQIALQSSTAWG